MIIFDLDGTLADCEHRRHFVDGKHYKNIDLSNSYGLSVIVEGGTNFYNQQQLEKFKPDWQSFYEACNEDTPIWPVVRIIESIFLNQVTMENAEIQVWSGRSESVRDKTEHWLKYIVWASTYKELKMRPIGNTEPDEVLKERWLDEVIAVGRIVDFVFDDRPKVVRMWKRRGIFVFNCCQHDEEF